MTDDELLAVYGSIRKLAESMSAREAALDRNTAALDAAIKQLSAALGKQTSQYIAAVVRAQSALPVPPDPLGRRLAADLVLGGRLAQAQPPFQYAPAHLLSTVNCQSGMMMIVHPFPPKASICSLQTDSPDSNGWTITS